MHASTSCVFVARLTATDHKPLVLAPCQRRCMYVLKRACIHFSSRTTIEKRSRRRNEAASTSCSRLFLFLLRYAKSALIWRVSAKNDRTKEAAASFPHVAHYYTINCYIYTPKTQMHFHVSENQNRIAIDTNVYVLFAFSFIFFLSFS